MSEATGYVYDPATIAANVTAFGAMGVDLTGNTLAGICQRKIAQGICYENLRDNEREYLASSNAAYTQTGRRITEGGTLEPIMQRTGVCCGCSFSAAQFLAWVTRYVLTGTGPAPQEVSLVAPYLLGRGNIRGDGGAYPSHSALGSHNVGVLTTAGLCRSRRVALQNMTTAQQELIAIELRDRPALSNSMMMEMEDKKTRVYMPSSYQLAADCISNGYPVTVGMTSQIAETHQSSNGISTFYSLGGGHETVLDGWYTLRGRLGFLKSESWGKFPASKWPVHRVTIQTDGGPVQLYEGQGACMADDTWACRPEAWAIGWVGSV